MRSQQSFGSTRAFTARRNVVAHAGKVNVLVVGGGGREHSLVWRLAQSESTKHVYAAPGNPGTAAERNVTNVAVDVTQHAQVVQFCQEKGVGLVVVGPEVPLVAGLADDLTAAGIPTWGPSAKAAQLEGSKVFMKDICKKYNIPTAAYEKFTDPGKAKDFIRSLGAPVVVKASGLAAGKGVVVAQRLEEALRAVDDMMVRRVFGAAGEALVVEEFLEGEEASLFALVNGEQCTPLVAAQDHKAVGDGDTGPNTGGMGTYSPAPVATPAIVHQAMEELVYRTARGMAAEGCPFVGTLFAGLMIKDGKAKLLEHNVRFGDPECQSLMARLDSDLTQALLQAVSGRMHDVDLHWRPEAAVTVVMAAKGYPGEYRQGTLIRGLEHVTDAKVFHAGTALNAAGELVSKGGRVLGVTALGQDTAEAQAKAYKAVKQIEWEDAYYRTDIGWRAIARMKAAAQ
ncbi:phosphoribosylglycinamide synthetase [Haematococcus lacustris]